MDQITCGPMVELLRNGKYDISPKVFHSLLVDCVFEKTFSYDFTLRSVCSRL